MNVGEGAKTGLAVSWWRAACGLGKVSMSCPRTRAEQAALRGVQTSHMHTCRRSWARCSSASASSEDGWRAWLLHKRRRTMSKDIKRRELLQGIAAASSAVGLAGCDDLGGEIEALGTQRSALVPMPRVRAYVTTNSVTVGQKLMWAATSTLGGAALFRIGRVTAIPIPKNPTLELSGNGFFVLDTAISLVATPAEKFNGEEDGYGWQLGASLGDPSIQGELVPTSATPGLYAAQWRFPNTPWESGTIVYFVVRPASPSSADIVLCFPFATTVAYAGGAPNTTVDPDNIGIGNAGQHKSLYDSFQPKRTRRVSLDRPWDTFAGGNPDESTFTDHLNSVDKRVQTVVYPFRLYQFLIANGVPASEINICTSFDLHSDSALLNSSTNLFISAGHDEYWSMEMCDRVRAFVASGGNAAFFSANTAWWQVRFSGPSGRTMECYKSGVEDPVALVNPSRTTGNFSASPTNAPENTLTGVSYRRGVAFANDANFRFWKTGATEGQGWPNYLTGVTTNPFGPANLLSYETDAVDCDGLFRATGEDGSPKNLIVIAQAAAFNETASQKGRATMARFTNVGTVFTAATTEWCNCLGDPDVKRITNNVISDLKVRHTGRPAWTPAVRNDPGNTWQVIDSNPAGATAITGVVQGHLLMRTPTAVRRRDPETSAGSWDAANTQVPATVNGAIPEICSMATDLLGWRLYAGTNQGVFRRSSNPTRSESWGEVVQPPVVPVPPAVNVCLGLGLLAAAEVFALFSSESNSLYLRQDWAAGPWKRLGSTTPFLRTITALDSKLFGSNLAGGELYCRESSPVDLVWTKIGTMPDVNTKALAAYYGRLFALGNQLHWRAAVPDANNPFRAPSQLFLKGASAVVGRLEGNGDFITTGTGLAPAAYDKVTRANDGMVFFFGANGSGDLRKYNADGSFQSVRTWAAGSFGAWSSISYIRNDDSSSAREFVIFYDATHVLPTLIGHFDPTTGVWIVDQQSTSFSAGWTHIVCTNGGTLFFYNANNGNCAYGTVSASGVFTGTSGPTLLTGWQTIVPVGGRYLFFYNASGTNAGHGALVDLTSGLVTTKSWPASDVGSFSAGWLLGPCANGMLLFYDPVSGGAAAGGFAAQEWVPLREFPSTSFLTAVTHIVPMGRL
jgi:hypothetical protein